MRQTLANVKRNVLLAWDLAFRDLKARYGTSSLGFFWLVISPLSFAAIYWLVFGYFLQLKWLDPRTGNEVAYIAPLFAGLATYLFVSDAVMGALTTYRSKREYVRRASVALWILWVAVVLRVAAQSACNFLLLIPIGIATGLFTWSVLLYAPFALGLVFLAVLSITLVLGLVGAFFTDLDEISRILLRVAFYTAPITYPMNVVPERLHYLINANPLTVLSEAVRDSLIFGLSPGLLSSAMVVVFSFIVLSAGVWLYQRLKGVIVDVV